jgi:hypothetical protein
MARRNRYHQARRVQYLNQRVPEVSRMTITMITRTTSRM